MDQIDKLLSFTKRQKFSEKEWNKRGLNPSSDELSQYLSELFNLCADKLMEAIQNKYTSKQLKTLLKSNISLFNKRDYDTEEKEYICDLFNELAKIVGVDFKDELNKWLYGSILSSFLKINSQLRSKKVIETISQPCTKCGNDLETYILKKEKGIPESSWSVVKCGDCEELNLLALGPEIKETRFGNYQWVRTLFKDEYSTYDKALKRLEQIKVFKK